MSDKEAYNQRCAGHNGDVWHELQQRAAAGQGIQPVKATSHLTLKTVVGGAATAEYYVGNHLADIAAEAAEELSQRPFD